MRAFGSKSFKKISNAGMGVNKVNIAIVYFLIVKAYLIFFLCLIAYGFLIHKMWTSNAYYKVIKGINDLMLPLFFAVLSFHSLQVIILVIRFLTDSKWSIILINHEANVILAQCFGITFILVTILLYLYLFFLRLSESPFSENYFHKQSLLKIATLTIFKLVLALATVLVPDPEHLPLLFLSCTLLSLVSSIFYVQNQMHTSLVFEMIDCLSNTLPITVSAFSFVYATFSNPIAFTNLILNLLGLQLTSMLLFYQAKKNFSKVDFAFIERLKNDGDMEYHVAKTLHFIKTSDFESKAKLLLSMDEAPEKFLLKCKSELSSGAGSKSLIDATLQPHRSKIPNEEFIHTSIKLFLFDYLKKLLCVKLQDSKALSLDILYSYIMLVLNTADMSVQSIFNSFTVQIFKMRSLSFMDKQKQYFLQVILKQFVGKSYENIDPNYPLRISKAFEFNRQCLKLARYIHKTTKTPLEMWNAIKNDNANTSLIFKSMNKLYSQNIKIDKILQFIKPTGSLPQSLNKLYAGFLINVMHDREKWQSHREHLNASGRVKSIDISDFEIQGKKIMNDTAKSFIILSGDDRSAGKILEVSEEIKHQLRLKDDSYINKSIDKLKPQCLENYYKNWIIDFYSNEPQSVESSRRVPSIDIFLDSDGFVKVFWRYIRMLPSFKDGIQFVLFFAPASFSRKEAGLIIYEKSFQKVIAVNKYMKKTFKFSPQTIEICDSFNLECVRVDYLFNTATSSISYTDICKEGYKNILNFSLDLVHAEINQQLRLCQSQSLRDENRTVQRSESSGKKSIESADSELSLKSNVLKNSEQENYFQAQESNKTYLVQIQVFNIFSLNDQDFVIMGVEPVLEEKEISEEVGSSLYSQSKRLCKSNTGIISYNSVGKFDIPVAIDKTSKYRKYITLAKVCFWGFQILLLALIIIMVVQLKEFIERKLRIVQITDLYTEREILIVNNYLNVEYLHYLQQLSRDKGPGKYFIDRGVNATDFIYSAHFSLLNYYLEFKGYSKQGYSGYHVTGDVDTSYDTQIQEISWANIVHDKLQYKISANTMYLHFAWVMERYLLHLSKDLFEYIDMNFSQFFLQEKLFIPQLLNNLEPSFESQWQTIRILLSFGLLLLILQSLFLISLLSKLDDKFNSVFHIFMDISPREAKKFISSIEDFNHKRAQIAHSILTASENHVSTNLAKTSKRKAPESLVTVRRESLLPSLATKIVTQASANHHQSFINTAHRVTQTNSKNQNNGSQERNLNVKFTSWMKMFGRTWTKYPSLIISLAIISLFGLYLIFINIWIPIFMKNISDINSIQLDLNSSKIFRVNLFCQRPCNDCSDSLKSLHISALAQINQLQQSLNSTKIWYFDEVNEFLLKVSNNFCSGFVYKNYPQNSQYDAICSKVLKFNQGLLVSLTDAYFTFFQLIDKNSSSYKSEQVSYSLHIAEQAFTDYFVALSGKIKKAFYQWKNDVVLFLEMITSILTILNAILCYLSLRGSHKEYENKMALRSQSLKLLKSNIFAANIKIITKVSEIE